MDKCPFFPLFSVNKCHLWQKPDRQGGRLTRYTEDALPDGRASASLTGEPLQRNAFQQKVKAGSLRAKRKGQPWSPGTRWNSCLIPAAASTALSCLLAASNP